jgi:hypothetical protein
LERQRKRLKSPTSMRSTSNCGSYALLRPTSYPTGRFAQEKEHAAMLDRLTPTHQADLMHDGKKAKKGEKVKLTSGQTVVEEKELEVFGVA